MMFPKTAPVFEKLGLLEFRMRCVCFSEIGNNLFSTLCLTTIIPAFSGAASVATLLPTSSPETDDAGHCEPKGEASLSGSGDKNSKLKRRPGRDENRKAVL